MDDKPRRRGLTRLGFLIGCVVFIGCVYTALGENAATVAFGISALTGGIIMCLER